MKVTVAQKIRIGLFTIIGLIALMAGLLVIGSKKNIFAETFTIYGTFKTVGGLQIGNFVRFSGIDVGTVTGINIENDSTVKVTMRLKENVHRFLKNDAMASIGNDGLMGDKLINISPGPVGDKRIENGGQIRTASPVEFDKIINKISRVADNAESITSSLAGIATQINSGKGSIGRLIYSDTLERGLEKTVNTAHETISAAKKGAEGFQENMTAMKHNILLKGFYKKKDRKERKEAKKQERQERKQERQEKKNENKTPENGNN